MENYIHFLGPSATILRFLEAEEDEKTLPPEFLKITLIDEIIRDFFAMYNVDNLLKDVEKFGDGKGTLIDYKFKGKTYNGTLCNRKKGYPETRNRLTIRLSSDGFRYGLVDRSFVIQKVIYRKSPGWLIVNETYLEKMTQLKKLATRFKCKIEFLYHPILERIDIKFRNSESGCQLLKICLHHGNSKWDDKDEYYLDLK